MYGVATCLGARARLVVPARGRGEPGTRAHGDWGRAGRKRSEGAGEVEEEPPSGTEREGGADGEPPGANRSYLLLAGSRLSPAFAGAEPGRFGAGREEKGAEDGD